jgi:2-haloacid dehalogenase
MQEILDQKVEQYPEWAEEILAFGADREFVKQVRKIIPGMQDVLQEITNNGDRITGLTNWASDTYDVLPASFPNILGHFNQVVVSGKLGIKKPSVDIFKRAHTEFGNPVPSNVYYFDDKPSNVEAAKQSAGCNAFTFQNEHTVRKALGLEPKIV